MKIVATIEARMNSSRLPGKVMLQSQGKTMLGHLVARLNSVKAIDEIILATTTNSVDKILQQEAKNLNIKTFCGDEENVMERVILAAEMVNADIIVETTADCPILDPWIVQKSIEISKQVIVIMFRISCLPLIQMEWLHRFLVLKPLKNLTV